MVKLLARYRRHLRSKAAGCEDAGARLIELQSQCLPWVLLWGAAMQLCELFGVSRAASLWVVAACVAASIAAILYVGRIFIGQGLARRRGDGDG
jgi:hypothetical protein